MIRGDDRLAGVITFGDLGDRAFDTKRDKSLTAADVMRGQPTVLYADQSLDSAIKVFTVSGDVHVPVLEDKETRRLIGMAHEHEVMARYHRALVEARREEGQGPAAFGQESHEVPGEAATGGESVEAERRGPDRDGSAER